jgi:hypothetical protein
VVVVPFAVGPDAAVDDQVTARVGELRHRPAAVVELEGEVADRLPPAVEAQVQAQARPAGQPPAVDDPAAAPRPAEGPLPFGDGGWPPPGPSRGSTRPAGWLLRS